jgi:tRNA(fMet)-specific endonuclease VapC
VPFVLDTNVAIHLRDGDAAVTARVASLDGAVLLSVVTPVELEGGICRDLAQSAIRRASLDVMLEALPTVAFDAAAADAYDTIAAHAGYSRPSCSAA